MILDTLTNWRRYSALAEHGPVGGYRGTGKMVPFQTERSGVGEPE